MKGWVKGTSPTHGNAKSTQELLLLSFRNNPRRPPWPVYQSSLLLSQKVKKISTRIKTSLFSGCQITIALALILINLLWVWGDTETLLSIVNLVSIPESPWGALCFVCVCMCVCVCVCVCLILPAHSLWMIPHLTEIKKSMLWPQALQSLALISLQPKPKGFLFSLFCFVFLHCFLVLFPPPSFPYIL